MARKTKQKTEKSTEQNDSIVGVLALFANKIGHYEYASQNVRSAFHFTNPVFFI